MLIEVKDKVVSSGIFEKKFVCDLNACKGACCVEGDAGAPLKPEEVGFLEEDLEAIKPYMRQEGIDAVEKQGVFYMDWDNEPVTTLVNGKECAFVYFDGNGITKCAVEQAYNEKKTKFKKPISCHLYPIRIQKYTSFEALNYAEWDICQTACVCGSELDVRVYKFLKEPIIRAFGQEFFDELEQINNELAKKNYSLD